MHKCKGRKILSLSNIHNPHIAQVSLQTKQTCLVKILCGGLRYFPKKALYFTNIRVGQCLPNYYTFAQETNEYVERWAFPQPPFSNIPASTQIFLGDLAQVSPAKKLLDWDPPPLHIFLQLYKAGDLECGEGASAGTTSVFPRGLPQTTRHSCGEYIPHSKWIPSCTT